MPIVGPTLDTMLANVIATGRAYDPATTFIGLFTAIADHGVDTILSDLVLAPGTLATAVVFGAWGTPYVQQDGTPTVDQPPHVFVAASGADDCTVLGYYLATLATAGALKAYGYLPAPVNLVNGGTALSIVYRLVMPVRGEFDQSVSWNG